MRVAFAGKGGAGKTTIAATMARLAARRGTTVLAIDADSNPNLAAALGVDPTTAATLAGIPAAAVSRKLTGPSLTISIDDVFADYGTLAPDGVRLLLMGAPAHAGEGCLCSAHAAVSAVLSDLADSPATLAIVDLEASPEHISRGTARFADVIVLVTEPYYRSLEATRRLADLAAELPDTRTVVAVNKVRSPADGDAVAEFCERHGLARIGEVPFSDDVVDADRRARPVLDAHCEGPVVAAISELLDALVVMA
ncbi:MAG: AAA family ATPase [Ilumatobacteraceae bacterium]